MFRSPEKGDAISRGEDQRSPASSRGKARRALRTLVVVVLVALGVSLIALVALFLGLEGGVIGGRFMLKSDEIIV